MCSPTGKGITLSGKSFFKNSESGVNTISIGYVLPVEAEVEVEGLLAFVSRVVGVCSVAEEIEEQPVKTVAGAQLASSNIAKNDFFIGYSSIFEILLYRLLRFVSRYIF
tara:strand:- start:2840 stop:3166 length:327 start_codon:yes stop_codon:yes gene_type:complete